MKRYQFPIDFFAQLDDQEIIFVYFQDESGDRAVLNDKEIPQINQDLERGYLDPNFHLTDHQPEAIFIDVSKKEEEEKQLPTNMKEKEDLSYNQVYIVNKDADFPSNLFYLFSFSLFQQDSNDGEKQSCQQKETKLARHNCDLCDYYTQNSGNLNSHKKRHSWNQAFRCPRCTYSAIRQQDIDKHLKKDHLNATRLRDGPMASLRSRAVVSQKNNSATRVSGPIAKPGIPAEEG